ncbi:MAG: amino acid adenylation domain-containing protein [Pirellula sp.]
MKILSSVRDYPAGHELESRTEQYRDEVLHTLNECFDALLVHSDPSIARLDSQFPWVRQISIPIHYTGYVAESIPDQTLQVKDRFEDSPSGRVIVSSGGLRDGFRLAKHCAMAWKQLHERGLLGGREMVIFAGLFAEKGQYEALEQMLQGGPFQLRRFGNDFLNWMRHSDLSISQAGYNTTMNVLETRTRAILAPNRVMTDQTKRARTLGERGLIDVIDIETITPEQLSSRILTAFSRQRPEHSIDTNGAQRTCDIIDSLLPANFDSACRPSAVANDASCCSFADQLPQTDKASGSPDPRGSADELITHRFERFAAERPTHLAIKTPTEELSFANLNAKSNQIARFIQAQGKVSERPVLLLIEPGPEHAIGILGILKAGRSYVPLRTSHPLQRLQFILDDSQADLLVTNSLNLPLAQELANGRIPIVNLNAVDQAISSDNLKLAISPDSQASITYTSGSSGRPKGVIHTHRSTLYSGQAAGDANITPNDRVLAAGSTISFNRVMINGATVYPWHVAQEGLYHLADWIQSEAITVFLSVPSVFRNFAATLTQKHRFPNLRRVVLTGETLYRKDVMLFREHFPSECLLVNELGCSETKSYLQFVIDRNTVIDGDIVPVGFELSGRTIQLLGENGRPVNIGEVGEMVVRSRHMSHGYLNRPELTSERFRLDPESDGERIYRTGDLAYQLPNGCFVHVGRKDFQLKIRGQRTELGEIEATLRHLSSVREAVVVALGNSSSDTRLVAYVVPDSVPRPTVSSLAEGLRAKLPAHMIPTAFVLLDALPMTPNGKIDRLALPAPGRSRPNLAVPYAKPRDGVEETLVQFWSEVLDVDQVGIRDDFYELGGDSLRATMVHSRIIAKFRVQLPLRDVFHMRTIAELAQAIASASQQSVTPCESLEPMPIQSRDEAATFPASFAQQRLWLLHHIDPSAAYNDILAWRLAGSLNVDALRSALNSVVNRHEVLRTTIRSTGEHVVQTIERWRPVELLIVDLDQQLAGDERETALKECLAAEAKRPFDLSRDSVLRARLVRLTDHEHVLALTLHHIATDAWSSGILARDIATFYNAFCSGSEPQLLKLPVQYADYAVWQRKNLSSGELQAQLEYWRTQLEGASETLELPTDRPRSHQKTHDGAQHSFQLSASVSNSLRQLVRDADTTLFSTTASAFATLLSRYSNSHDIVLGTPIAGRRRVESEGLVGFFVNTLALRIDLVGDPTFEELLQRVHGVAVDAFANQDVPFEKLVEELRPQRRLSHTPLFQVMFALQNAPRRELKLSGIESSRVSVHNGTSKFDLTLTLVDTPDGLRGRMVYDTQLFDASTIERMCRHYETLLEGVAATPESRLSELPLLSPNERELLLKSWSGAHNAVAITATIHQLFEAQVAEVPDNPAVVFEDQVITYRQLNERANSLAQRLRAHNVAPGTSVAICMERSIEWVVGLLGILKAGGAYVPLDPSNPPQRIASAMETAAVRVLLTTTSLRDRLECTNSLLVCIDEATCEIGPDKNTHNLEVNTDATGLAYIVFTSGSTGIPKGVAIPHQAVIRLVKDTNYIELTPADAVAQMSNCSFDAATFEIWGALLNGSRLVLIPTEVMLSPRALAARLRETQVTTLFLTTALFKQVALEHPTAFSTVRNVLFGGEVVDPKCVREVLASGPPERLLHVYGPTETTTFATFFQIEHVPENADSLPIGKPISNTSVYVLDAQLRPVPIGIPGELCIGGLGLADGYAGSPELTVQRFVPHPFSDLPGDRLYRTGDIVRWRPDGNLDFIGRRDSQVKIRGFRVEPGEIEAVLAEHPQVQQVAVIAEDDAHCGRYLVAYIVPHSGYSPRPEDLRQFLAGRLPDYMIPSAYGQIERLPLTPNGKLDRRALPLLGLKRREDEIAYTPPKGEWEEKLSAIWSQLLGRERISAHDNFFDLGGHSLLALSLLSRIEKAGGPALKLKTLFQHPTLRQFAIAMEASSPTDATAAIFSLRGPLEKTKDGRVPMVIAPSIFGHTHGWEELFDLAARDRAIFGLEIEGSRPYWTEQPSLQEIAHGFATVLKERFPDGRFHLMGYSFGGTLAYAIGRQFELWGYPPLTIFLLDTSLRSTNEAWHGRDVMSMLLNFPRWMNNELTTYSIRVLAKRVLKRFSSAKTVGGPTDPRAEEVSPEQTRLLRYFDLSGWPSFYQQRLTQGYQAIREYHPTSTRNRIVYLRCRILPLIHRVRPDGGWGGLVAEGSLEIRAIPGEHGSVLHGKRRDALAKTINDCLQHMEIELSRARPYDNQSADRS